MPAPIEQIRATTELLRRAVEATPHPADNIEDPRDNANHLFATRTVACLAAFGVLDVTGDAGPVGAVVRSAFETNLTWRWVLSAPERASKWCEVGHAHLAHVAQGLGVTEEEARTPEGQFVATLAEVELERGANRMPFRKYAEDVGDLVNYNFYYPLLSGIAHPNRSSMLGTDDPVRMVLLRLVGKIQVDAGNLFTMWVMRRELAPILPR